jgi:hypothetical protein
MIGIFEYLNYKVANCSSNCVICDEKLYFKGLKPAVCDKELCLHSLHNYGLGIDIINEIINNGKVVDLLICYLSAACAFAKSGKKNKKKKNFY